MCVNIEIPKILKQMWYVMIL